MSRLRDATVAALFVATAYTLWSGPEADRVSREHAPPHAPPASAPLQTPDPAAPPDGRLLPVSVPPDGGVTSPGTVAAPEDKLEIFREERYVSATSLRLRAGPSTAARTIASLPTGTRVSVLGATDEWLRIRLSDGRTGWASARYLSPTEPPIAPPTVPPSAPPQSAATARTVKAPARDRDAIARELIDRSIASYGGSCPCPYNRDRSGRSCGARSAYSRPGGEAPLCYLGDVTDAMIAAFR